MPRRNILRRITHALWGGYEAWGFAVFVVGAVMSNGLFFLFSPFAQDIPWFLKVIYGLGLFVVALVLSVVFIRLLQFLIVGEDRDSGQTQEQTFGPSGRVGPQAAQASGGSNIHQSTTYNIHLPLAERPPGEVEKVSTPNQEPKIHVESHNQQGGITAHQVNIHQQPNDRQLTDKLVNQLRGYLSGWTFDTIEVMAIHGDGEAHRFASKIKDFLVSEGHKVIGVNSLLAGSPPSGQNIAPPNAAGFVVITIGHR